MSWLRTHVYLASLVGALIITVLGALIVVKRSTVNPQPSGLRAWGGVGSDLFDPTNVRSERQPLPQENLYTEVQNGPPFYYAPAANQLPLVQSQGGDDFDFESFIALLSVPSSSGKSTQTSGTELDAYAFIPQGLISTSTGDRERTPIQQALFNYGNEVGSYIQSYEERYRAAPQILRDQFEDRENAEKIAALRSLAGALEDVGYQLEGFEEIPSEVSAAHLKVAASYKELGTKLALIPEAKVDKEIIDAMLAYNAAVETYTKNYISLATLLSLYGVAFSQNDPGNVFTFSPTPTL